MKDKEHAEILKGLIVPIHAEPAMDRAIELLEQEPKTGHWIVEKWNNKEHHTCSVCQIVVDYEPCYHYCPYCGAKMAESEDE